jgi:hypothetical protein
MAWYLWVLIVIGVVAIGALKLSVFKKIMAKRKEKADAAEEED